jgi:hypothetical protein
MAPLRGWGPRGERIKAHVPHGHWQTMTFLAALRQDRVTAPWLLDGPMNGESFRVYVTDVLAPTLRPGDIVIMDNLGSHRSQAVRQAREQLLSPKLHAGLSTVCTPCDGSLLAFQHASMQHAVRPILLSKFTA